MKKAVAAAVALAACSSALSADERDLLDLSLQELMQQPVAIVYGASRYEQKVTQAPSSITLITAEEIRRYGHRTLAEVLRSVRGLYVPDDRNYTFLGIRGFHRPGDYNSRVLVTIDGHRINDSIYDGGTVGREGMVDVELIDRVEIIRGPSSSIYGSSAFFGVINVITKRGAHIDGVELLGDGGTFGSYRGGLTYGDKLANGAEWLVSASQYTSDGAPRLYFPEFDQRISAAPTATNDGFAVGLDGEENQNLFAKARYGELTLSAFYNARSKQVPTASFGTVFNDGREKTVDYRSYVDVKYEHDFNEALQVQARAFYDQYRYKGWYPYDYEESGETSDLVLMKDGSNGEWLGTELQVTANTSSAHKLILGGEYRANLREQQWAYDDIDPRYYYIDANTSSQTFGLFAQSETKVTDDLLLLAGVRFDRYSEGFDDSFNPRFGLIYSLSQNATLKGLYGEAFRAPNPFERDYYEEQANHPVLQPEKIQTYELVYEQYFGRRYRLNASSYYYHINGLITQQSTDGGIWYYYENLDHVRAAGIELEIEGNFDSGAHVRASYALQRTEDESTGEELSSSPNYLAKLNASVPLVTPKLLGGLELQHHSDSITVNGGSTGGFTIVNLTLLSRGLIPGLEISGSIYNMFDERYGYSGSQDHLQSIIEQNGRTFRGKFVYKF